MGFIRCFARILANGVASKPVRALTKSAPPMQRDAVSSFSSLAHSRPRISGRRPEQEERAMFEECCPLGSKSMRSWKKAKAKSPRVCIQIVRSICRMPSWFFGQKRCVADNYRILLFGIEFGRVSATWCESSHRRNHGPGLHFIPSTSQSASERGQCE